MPLSDLTYSFIPRWRSSFFAISSSGFSAPVSNLRSMPAFSLICIPSCSWVRFFFMRASRMSLGKPGSSVNSSDIVILAGAKAGAGLFFLAAGVDAGM